MNIYWQVTDITGVHSESYTYIMILVGLYDKYICSEI